MPTENTTTPVDDSEAWENGTLGQNLEHAAVSTVDPKIIDDALGIELISFRLSKDIVEALDDLARLNNSSRNALIQAAVAHFVCHNEPREDIETVLYVAFNKIATYRHNTPDFSLARVNKFISVLSEIDSWAEEFIAKHDINTLEYLSTIIAEAIRLYRSEESSMGRRRYISISENQYESIVTMFGVIKELANNIAHYIGRPKILGDITNILRLLLNDIINDAFIRYKGLADNLVTVLGPDLVNLGLSEQDYERVVVRATELQIEPVDLVINVLVANS